MCDQCATNARPMCDHCATNAIQFPEAALSAGSCVIPLILVNELVLASCFLAFGLSCARDLHISCHLELFALRDEGSYRTVKELPFFPQNIAPEHVDAPLV